MLYRGMQWLAWFLYLAGCLLILSNTVADYRPGGPGIFIFQKGGIGESMAWRVSLYVHIAGGLLCLFAALPQLSGKLVARFPSMPPFSRAMVVRPYPSYRAVELVDGEERLPFTVQMLGSRDNVTGYVRIADNAIYLFCPEKKDHIRSTLDPRFAPPKEIRIEPEKPA